MSISPINKDKEITIKKIDFMDKVSEAVAGELKSLSDLTDDSTLVSLTAFIMARICASITTELFDMETEEKE